MFKSARLSFLVGLFMASALFAQTFEKPLYRFVLPAKQIAAGQDVVMGIVFSRPVSFDSSRLEAKGHESEVVAVSDSSMQIRFKTRINEAWSTKLFAGRFQLHMPGYGWTQSGFAFMTAVVPDTNWAQFGAQMAFGIRVNGKLVDFTDETRQLISVGKERNLNFVTYNDNSIEVRKMQFSLDKKNYAESFSLRIPEGNFPVFYRGIGIVRNKPVLLGGSFMIFTKANELPRISIEPGQRFEVGKGIKVPALKVAVHDPDGMLGDIVEWKMSAKGNDYAIQRMNVILDSDGRAETDFRLDVQKGGNYQIHVWQIDDGTTEPVLEGTVIGKIHVDGPSAFFDTKDPRTEPAGTMQWNAGYRGNGVFHLGRETMFGDLLPYSSHKGYWGTSLFLSFDPRSTGRIEEVGFRMDDDFVWYAKWGKIENRGRGLDYVFGSRHARLVTQYFKRSFTAGERENLQRWYATQSRPPYYGKFEVEGEDGNLTTGNVGLEFEIGKTGKSGSFTILPKYIASVEKLAIGYQDRDGDWSEAVYERFWTSRVDLKIQTAFRTGGLLHAFSAELPGLWHDESMFSAPPRVYSYNLALNRGDDTVLLGVSGKDAGGKMDFLPRAEVRFGF